MEKDRKIAKKAENSTIKPLPGGRGNGKNDRKIAKRLKNSTIKPLSTISVLCMKIQGGHGPLPTSMPTHTCIAKL